MSTHHGASTPRPVGAPPSSDPSRCPPAETLAAYSDGLLGPLEKRQVAEHVSRCEDCYTVVREAVAFAGEEGGASASVGAAARRARQWHGSWALPVAAAIVLGVGGLMLAQRGRMDAYERVLQPLVNAVGDRRPFEARLTGGFRWGPLVTASRSGAERVETDWRIVAAAGPLKDEGEGAGTADATKQRARAAAQLLTGEAAAAEETLEKLAARHPRDPDVLSDLAAARLVLYRSHGQDAALPRAVEAAAAALEIAPNHAEAAFNRALALQWQGLRRRAAEAWKLAAQAADGQADKRWRDEALAALRELEKVTSLDRDELSRRIALGLESSDRGGLDQAVATSPWVAWEFFEEMILPGLGPGAGAPAHRLLAEVFLERTRDETMVRVVSQPGAPGLREAHARYSRARQLYRSDAWLPAEREFEHAAPALRAAGSPLAAWADLHLLILDYQKGRVPKGRARLAERADRLRTLVDGESEPLLSGRVEWMRTLIGIGEGRFAAAVTAAEAGEAHFRRAGESAGAALLAALKAQALRAVGRPELAWAGVHAGLAAIPSMPSASRATNMLFQAGDLARSSLLSRAAREIDLEAAGLADEAGTPLDRAEALLRLAQNPGAASPDAGDGRESAVSLVARARSAIEQVEDPTVAARLEGEAEWLDLLSRKQAGQPVTPDQWLERAAWFSQRRDRTREARAQALAAAESERTGGRSAALEAYERAFALMEAAQGVAHDLGISQAEQARQVLEGWLRLAPAGDPRWALDRIARYLELLHPGRGRSRERGVLELEGQQADDERTVVLVPVEGAVAAWVVGPAGIEERRLAPLTREASLEPLVPLIAPARVVSFVPLWEAADAPLGAWVARHRALGDVREVGLRQRIGSPRRNERPASARPTLAVGLSSSVADLPPIPHAEAEASAFSAHAGSWLLTGPGASETRVVELLPRASAFYFAGHAVENAERFGLSALLLSPGAQDGYLTAAEITRLDLSGLRVVVLSACSSGITRTTRRYARSSLAQAFLRAGAASVVGTLADVPDDAVARAMSSLQPEIARGVAAAAAVLALQRRGRDSSGASVADLLVVWTS